MSFYHFMDSMVFLIESGKIKTVEKGAPSMRLIQSWIAVTMAALATGGCSSGNFMVYKSGVSFYVTSDSPRLNQILCDSGDMDSIVKGSELPPSLQKELKEGVCATDKSRERLLSTLDGMTEEQQTALKDAFRRNGYEINRIADPCGGG